MGLCRGLGINATINVKRQSISKLKAEELIVSADRVGRKFGMRLVAA